MPAMLEKLTERWNAVSLRTKMTGVSVLLLTVGLVVSGIGSMSVLSTYLSQSVDDRISTASRSLSLADVTITADSCAFDRSQYTDYVYVIYASDGTPLCSNRTAKEEQPAVQSLSLGYAKEHSTPFTVPSTVSTDRYRAITALYTITLDPGTIDQRSVQVPVLVALNLAESNDTIARFAAIFLFFGLTVVIFGAALTRLLVTSTFAPLREVEATAARFAAGDFNQRIAGATPNTEVGRLNRSLNSMLTRIDSAFSDRARTIEQMRRFVGDASHELRTPLVSVRGYAELYRMGALTDEAAVSQAMERIEKEAIRMGGLVEDLLELARMDEAKPLQLADVDLVALARDAALDAMASSPDRDVLVIAPEPSLDDELAASAPLLADRPTELTEPPTPLLADEDAAATGAVTGAAAGAASGRRATNATGPIRFAGATFARLRARRARGTGPVPALPPLQLPRTVALAPSTHVVVVAEENKIRQVIANLLGNALRYTPEGSPLEIEVTRDGAAGTAAVAIVDHGEGIPPQLREKIFQRFWRADTSRARETGGNGLGLAIVAGIVEKHGGTIEVLETPGGGATFRVILPLLPRTPRAPSSTDPAPTASA